LKFEFLFPLDNVIEIKGFIKFPDEVMRKGIESEPENNKLIITCPGKAFGSQQLATCVIEEAGLRYTMAEAVKMEARDRQADEQEYYPIAKNLVIEMFDVNNIVYQCPIRKVEIYASDIEPIQFSIMDIFDQIREPKVPTKSEKLKDYLEKHLAKDTSLTSMYPLPFVISGEEDDYDSLVETLNFEKQVIELMPQIIQKNNTDKLRRKREKEQGKPKPNLATINKIDNDIKVIDEKNNFFQDLSSIIKEINDSIDQLDPAEYTDEEISEIKGYNLKPKLDELRKNYDFTVYLKNAWGLDLFSVEVKSTIDEQDTGKSSGGGILN